MNGSLLVFVVLLVLVLVVALLRRRWAPTLESVLKGAREIAQRVRPSAITHDVEGAREESEAESAPLPEQGWRYEDEPYPDASGRSSVTLVSNVDLNGRPEPQNEADGSAEAEQLRRELSELRAQIAQQQVASEGNRQRDPPRWVSTMHYSDYIAALGRALKMRLPERRSDREKLAERAGVSLTTIDKLLRGETNATLHSLFCVCRARRVPLLELFAEAEGLFEDPWARVAS